MLVEGCVRQLNTDDLAQPSDDIDQDTIHVAIDGWLLFVLLGEVVYEVSHA
jgi:hypothetical protein